MKLSGIDLQGKLRLTQPNDAMDIQLDLLRTGVAEIKPDFYTTVFFDLMNGNVTAVDDSGNSIETGIYFVVKDKDGNALATTPKSKLDWYEDDSNYYVEAKVDYNDSLSSDIEVASVDVYYSVNDIKNTQEKDVLIVSSTAPGKSTFASNGAISVEHANGDLTIRCDFLMVIGKK